ncbi:hypothetical protein BACI349Y_890009 [Bacillus sp. 349Y]|nr:hypothetical protein BACI349Y_890009 [Bacillus sp. 349Y]
MMRTSSKSIDLSIEGKAFPCTRGRPFYMDETRESSNEMIEMKLILLKVLTGADNLDIL